MEVGGDGENAGGIGDDSATKAEGEGLEKGEAGGLAAGEGEAVGKGEGEREAPGDGDGVREAVGAGSNSSGGDTESLGR